MKRKDLLLLTLLLTQTTPLWAMWNGDDDVERPGNVGQHVSQPEPQQGEPIIYRYNPGVASRFQFQRVGNANEVEQIRQANLPLYGHEGNNLIHVEPFSLQDPNQGTLNHYDGDYNFVSTSLPRNKRFPERQNGRFIYFDNQGRCFLPHIRQEKWKHQGANIDVGFFVASYNSKSGINFIKRTRLPDYPLATGFILPEGLYHLTSIEKVENEQKEIWKCLSGINKGSIKEVFSPLGCSSIPGFGAVVPYTVHAEDNVTQAKNLKRAIEANSDILNTLNTDPTGTYESIIFLGKTRAGKSTLANLIAGRPLSAREINRRLYLFPEDSIPLFEIGQGRNSCTSIPKTWRDESNRRILIDFPGFDDTRGPQFNIVNAQLLPTLLQRSRVKVMLTVAERDLQGAAQDFENLLKHVSQWFEDENELYQSVRLVVTGHIEGNLYEDLQQAHREFSARPRAQNEQPENRQRALNLLNHLATPQNAKVSSIPYPTEAGSYTANLDTLLQGEGVRNPRINVERIVPSLGTGTAEYIRTLGESLNSYLTNYIKTEGAKQIISHCRRKIDEFSPVSDPQGEAPTTTAGTTTVRSSTTATPVEVTPPAAQNVMRNAKALREDFGRLADTLSQLQLPDEQPQISPSEFVSLLRNNNIMNVDIIDTTIKNIEFLSRINPGVGHNTQAWGAALKDTIKKIRSLADLQKTEERNADGVVTAVTLKGTILGTSDLCNVYNSNVKKIVGFASNTLFFDNDIMAPGMSLCLFAPKWKLPAPRVINLSGYGRNNPALTKTATDYDGSNGYGRNNPAPTKTATDYDGAPGKQSIIINQTRNPRGQVLETGRVGSIATSGEKGSDGSHGQSGVHGRHGGNCYGNLFVVDGLNYLSAKTNGGDGGNGGRGGNGGNGGNGADGNPNEVTKCDDQPLHNHTINRDCFYNAQGMNGGVGGNGGKAGKGAPGGLAGINRIDGTDWNPPAGHITNGLGGSSGIPGTPGIGGIKGRNHQGQIFQRKHNHHEIEPDYIRTPLVHVEGNRTPAVGGTQYAETDLNDTGIQTPSTPVVLDIDTLIAQFQTWWNQQANNSHVNPFMRVFPGCIYSSQAEPPRTTSAGGATTSSNSSSSSSNS